MRLRQCQVCEYTDSGYEDIKHANACNGELEWIDVVPATPSHQELRQENEQLTRRVFLLQEDLRREREYGD